MKDEKFGLWRRVEKWNRRRKFVLFERQFRKESEIGIITQRF